MKIERTTVSVPMDAHADLVAIAELMTLASPHGVRAKMTDAIRYAAKVARAKLEAEAKP